MRKRKSPVALLTTLAIVVCGIVGLQYVTSKGSSPADQPPTPQVEDTKSVGDARPAESPSSIKEGITSALNTPSAKSPTAMSRPGPPGAAGGGPLILNPTPPSTKPEKPKPNASATSTQWYNDESALATDKG